MRRGSTPGLFRRPLAQGAALAALAGGAEDEGGLDRLVRSAPAARAVDGAATTAIAGLLATLYPERPGLGVPKPDILAEELVREELDRAADLLAAALAPERAEAEWIGAFVLLARLATRRPEAAVRLERALALDPQRLLAPALEAAKAAADPLAAPLERAREGFPEDVRRRLAVDLHPRRPEPTVALRRFALAVTRDPVAAARARRDDALLAASLTNLSNRLAALGRREEALAAVREAVERYRKLAERTPDAFAPELARSLGVRGGLRCDAGDSDAGLADLAEAIRILAPHVLRRPDAHGALAALLARDHRARCGEAGREPNAAPLPLREAALDRADRSGPPPDGRPPHRPPSAERSDR